jgi:hypothetical protein
MDCSIKFFTTVYISLSVAWHDMTLHPAYQPELFSSRTVNSSVTYWLKYSSFLWKFSKFVLLEWLSHYSFQLQSGWLGFDSWQGRMYLFTTTSCPPLFNPASYQMCIVLLFAWVKWTTHLRLVLRSRMSVLLTFMPPCMLSWHDT